MSPKGCKVVESRLYLRVPQVVGRAFEASALKRLHRSIGIVRLHRHPGEARRARSVDARREVCLLSSRADPLGTAFTKTVRLRAHVRIHVKEHRGTPSVKNAKTPTAKRERQRGTLSGGVESCVINFLFLFSSFSVAARLTRARAFSVIVTAIGIPMEARSPA